MYRFTKERDSGEYQSPQQLCGYTQSEIGSGQHYAQIQTWGKRNGPQEVAPLGNKIFVTDGSNSLKDKPDMRNTLIKVIGVPPPGCEVLECTLFTCDVHAPALVTTGHNTNPSSISLDFQSTTVGRPSRTAPRLLITSAPGSGVMFPTRRSWWRRATDKNHLQFEVQIWMPVPEGKVILQLRSKDGRWLARSDPLEPITTRAINSTGPSRRRNRNQGSKRWDLIFLSCFIRLT